MFQLVHDRVKQRGDEGAARERIGLGNEGWARAPRAGAIATPPHVLGRDTLPCARLGVGLKEMQQVLTGAVVRNTVPEDTQ